MNNIILVIFLITSIYSIFKKTQRNFYLNSKLYLNRIKFLKIYMFQEFNSGMHNRNSFKLVLILNVNSMLTISLRYPISIVI